MPLHIRKVSDLTTDQLLAIIKLAGEMKARPAEYRKRLKGRTALCLFAKPSLRTRVSLETAMTKLGGHAINYQLDHSAPLGAKESIEDTARVITRMVDVVTARIASRKEINALCDGCTIPVINALDDWAHPLQMVCDFLTIHEKFGTFEGLRFVYYGDSKNNVTYDLMRACSMLGMECTVCCPENPDFAPVEEVLEECRTINANTGGRVIIEHNPVEAAKGRDIVYTDSWMSYGIKPSEEAERVAVLGPYSVTSELMALTSERSVFMNCLPAMRGYEQTAEVVDGKKSIIFDQAENRLWTAMAVLTFVIEG